ncbi:MAG: hypothetical protein HZB50_17130 [Chloroflexi bacterium]|nr:hypothetical protein [Chloroflexota bacterium]
MENKDRFQYALEHITDKSVFIVERIEWERIVDKSGEPVKLANVPQPISGLVTMAAHVMTAGSGIYNPSPGIDVIRSDPKDTPYIYNIDHYTVLENFVSAPLYQEALKVARIEETEELNEYIQSHIFVVGPFREDNHWVEEIPKQIREAKQKG